MITSSFFFALHTVFIKILLNNHGIISVFGYTRFFSGVFSIPFIAPHLGTIKRKLGMILFFYFLTEGFTILGLLLFTIAASMWYVSIVSAITSLQYLFVFLLSYLLSKFYPFIFREEYKRNIVLLKLSSIVLILLGVFLTHLWLMDKNPPAIEISWMGGLNLNFFIFNWEYFRNLSQPVRRIVVYYICTNIFKD